MRAAPGAGLLDHGRAHLDWFGAVRLRHPQVTFESCASGAMRSDFARLARLDLQSTSDQQDPLLYPPIAAGAPMLMPPIEIVDVTAEVLPSETLADERS